MADHFIPIQSTTAIMSEAVYHSLLLLSSILLLSSYGGDSVALPSGCPVYDCGNGVKFSYPFWSTDNATGNEYCGYPQFGLSCDSENKRPVLSMDDEDYLVESIDYSNSAITLVDKDVIGNSCPRARHNISLENYPLNFTDLNVNISFYFNCSSNPFTSYAATVISCLGFGSLQSYVILVEDNTEEVGWEGRCEANVVVAVKKAADITGLGLVAEFGAAMNRGFVVDWMTDKECGECERNKGFCGYNRTAAEYMCYCQDGSISDTCKGNNKVKTKVIIGVSVFAGTVAIMLVLFFVYQRRKKNPYAPSSLVSQTNTSEFSSKFDSERGGSMYGVQLFTYEQLEEATDHFDPKKELGEGGFGTVYFGKLQDGRCVAVKRLYENNYKRVEQFLNEVDLLTRLRHPHLVSLYGCTSRHSRELLLVYEYIPNGTVADHLHGEKAKPGSLPWHTRMNIATETASALTYLHASDIIHRDVKTNNILLDDNFGVKVADFGLSRLFPLHVTHVSTAPQGTPGYVDPEYHECYQLTDKSDVYSFGVVLVELISSMPAVDITRHRHEINLSNMAINKIQSNALNELVDHSLGFDSDYAVRKMISAVAELAFQCLQSAKELRPTMDEVLETLKLIKDKDYSLETKQEMDRTSDDVGLLKGGQLPHSPDTVMIQWKSSRTTPNTSG